MNQKTNQKLTLFDYLMNKLFHRYLIRNRNPTESPTSTLLDFQIVPEAENHNVLIPNIYLNWRHHNSSGKHLAPFNRNVIFRNILLLNANSYVCTVKANEKLRELRVIKGLSQEVVASQLGIDSGTYSRMERGVTELKFELVGRILEILSISWDEFLKYDDQGQQTFNFQQGDNNSFQATVETSIVTYLKEELQALRTEVQELRKINLELTKQIISKNK
jgi:transcriptional regulator with XRE-family HTH domain